MRSTPSKSPTPPPSSTTEDVWRGRVAAWQRSGQAAVVWCTDKPFAASTLRVWASRLRRADAPAFLELRPRSSSPVTRHDLAVEVGDARVRVTQGFDPELLASVVAPRALRPTPSFRALSTPHARFECDEFATSK